MNHYQKRKHKEMSQPLNVHNFQKYNVLIHFNWYIASSYSLFQISRTREKEISLYRGKINYIHNCLSFAIHFFLTEHKTYINWRKTKKYYVPPLESSYRLLQNIVDQQNGKTTWLLHRNNCMRIENFSR